LGGVVAGQAGVLEDLPRLIQAGYGLIVADWQRERLTDGNVTVGAVAGVGGLMRPGGGAAEGEGGEGKGGEAGEESGRFHGPDLLT